MEMTLKWYKSIEITKTIYCLTLPEDMKSWKDITLEQLDEICYEFNSIDDQLDVEVSSLDSDGNRLDDNDVDEFCDIVYKRAHVLMCEKTGQTNVFQLNTRR